MAIDTIIPVILHLYLGFNGIISCIARIVGFIENVYHIRVWKALSKCTNFSDAATIWSILGDRRLLIVSTCISDTICGCSGTPVDLTVKDLF